jgi:hypothetical protein
MRGSFETSRSSWAFAREPVAAKNKRAKYKGCGEDMDSEAKLVQSVEESAAGWRFTFVSCCKA